MNAALVRARGVELDRPQWASAGPWRVERWRCRGAKANAPAGFGAARRGRFQELLHLLRLKPHSEAVISPWN
jgi:hypothetical protein